MYFEPYSERAGRAVYFALHHAKREKCLSIEPEHLLQGLLQEDPKLFSLVNPSDITLIENIQKDLHRDTDKHTSQAVAEFLPLSKQSKEIIKGANAERRLFKQARTGTDHLLLAILNSGNKRRGWLLRRKGCKSNVSEILTAHGITVEGLVRLMEKEHATPQTRETETKNTKPGEDA